jgi:hypothetical protein
LITIEREKEGAPLCSKVNPPCLVSQVRLLELYDVVDLFVLYEIPYTHMGADKPLYFNNSMSGACMLSCLRACVLRLDTVCLLYCVFTFTLLHFCMLASLSAGHGRWDRFLPKILHLIAKPEELASQRQASLAGGWELENDCRIGSVQRFARSSDPRAVRGA